MSLLRDRLIHSGVFQHAGPFSEISCSAFSEAYLIAAASVRFLLTNLKTHLIIRISKGQAVDGKRETKGRAYEDRVCTCLQTGAKRRIADRRTQRGEL